MSQTSNTAIAVIGIDIGKNSFHVVGHDARGAIVQVEARLANVPSCLIGMEACVGAHHLSTQSRIVMPVRCDTSRSRTRCSACRSSCSAVLVATNFIVGRCTASATASASLKSFFGSARGIRRDGGSVFPAQANTGDPNGPLGPVH